MKTSYTQRTLEFHKIYRSKILPDIMQYEDERKKRYIFTSIVYGAAVLCGLIFFGTCFLLAIAVPLPEDFVIPAFALCGPGFVVMLICSFVVKNKYGIKKFKQSLKTKYLPLLLKVFGDIKWYDAKSLRYIISDGLLYGSGLFSNFDGKYKDDQFEGVYKDVTFKISEIKLVSGKGKGDYSGYMVQVFKGVIITFDFNKTNPLMFAPTVITTKGDFKTGKYKDICYYSIPIMIGVPVALEINWQVGVIFAVICLIAMLPFLKKMQEKMFNDNIKLEDPEFSKMFEVTSSDEVEARYLITTAFMERFKNLNTAFGAKNAKCSFFEDKIMFAISTDKDVFEIGSLNKSLEDPESINEFYNELSSILDMIEYFKLDEKIGL